MVNPMKIKGLTFLPFSGILKGNRRRVSLMHNNDKITNVITVLYRMKKGFKSSRSTTDLRRSAVARIASLEARKYKNGTSSQKTIHDACARRFRPDIPNMKAFDVLADRWRYNQSGRLQRILQTHAHRSIARLFSHI
jgi:hypothetical protein